MKVLEIGTLNVKAGGPPFSISRQMYGLKQNGIDSLCLMSPCDEEYIIDKNLNFVFTKPVISRAIGLDYIPDIDYTLSKIEGVDLIHVQFVWTFISHSAAKYARSNHIPYVIAPRGSLYKRAMEDSKWLKKRIAWYLYQKEDLNKANCVQATCMEEMETLRSLGCDAPIAIIPNSYDAKRIKRGTYVNNDIFRIGYLGRLSPRKHVERLIYAFAELKKKYNNTNLWIIGSDDNRYEQFLRKECERLDLGDSVAFKGFLRLEALDNAIRQCHLFVFPSDYENFGNVVPDVLVREIPAIASKGMPWRIMEKEKCGWWIDMNQEALNKTLIEAYEKGFDQLREMGMRGRKLVEEQFSVGKNGIMLKELYTWILYGGNKPDFVYV